MSKYLLKNKVTPSQTEILTLKKCILNRKNNCKVWDISWWKDRFHFNAASLESNFDLKFFFFFFYPWNMFNWSIFSPYSIILDNLCLKHFFCEKQFVAYWEATQYFSILFQGFWEEGGIRLLCWWFLTRCNLFNILWDLVHWDLLSLLHLGSLVARCGSLGLLWFVEIRWDFYGEGGACLLFVYYLPMLDTRQGGDLLSMSLYPTSKLL